MTSEDRPVPHRPRSPPRGERRLSIAELEDVIGRAIELQAREAERHGDEGIGEEELVRIAGELGLSPAHVQRAIAEVRDAPAGEGGLLATFFGEAHVTASRVVALTAEAVRGQIESYMRDREAMVVQRRRPDRVVFERGSGMAAAVTRAATRVGARHPLLNVQLVEVAAHPVDDASCFVAITVRLGAQRAGYVAGTAAGGMVGGAAAFALANLFAPPAALIGLPVVAGFAYLMRSSYRNVAGRTLIQLESMLDRLEHGELFERGSPGLFRRLGL